MCVAPYGLAYTQNDAAGLTTDAGRVSSGFSAAGLVVVDRDTVARKIEEKREKRISFALVDLRLETEFKEGHLPGAVNVPFKKLRFLAERMFGKSDEIIFYGYSRNDAAGVDAVILLENKGFGHVSLMTGGMQEWKGPKE